MLNKKTPFIKLLLLTKLFHTTWVCIEFAPDLTKYLLIVLTIAQTLWSLNSHGHDTVIHYAKHIYGNTKALRIKNTIPHNVKKSVIYLEFDAKNCLKVVFPRTSPNTEYSIHCLWSDTVVLLYSTPPGTRYSSPLFCHPHPRPLQYHWLRRGPSLPHHALPVTSGVVEMIMVITGHRQRK